MEILNEPDQAEVLKLLYNYKNDNEITDLPNYPLTDPGFVEVISKSVADIIYNSYNNNSLNSQKTRETIIRLLRRWVKPKSHIPIDDSNCDIFIKSLIKEHCVLDSFYQKYGQDFIKVSTETSKVKTKDEWKNICETVNKKYISSLEDKIKSGLIQKWNKTQFDQTNFDYNGPNKTFQNIEVENLIEYLRTLKKKPDIGLENIHKSNENELDFLVKFRRSVSKEESSVQLGYVVLHFEQNANNEKLFLRVLRDISESRSESGLKFVNHIWANKDNLQLSKNIYKTILKFKHIYEIPIITIATEILQNINKESIDDEYEIIIENSNIKKVLEISSFDLELRNNIIFVINKLLILSKFDLRIFKFLKIVKKYISTTN